MKKFIKYVFVTLSALVVLLLVAVSIAAFVPNQTYQNLIVKAAGKQNIVVDFQSPLIIERSLTPTITLNNVSVYRYLSTSSNESNTKTSSSTEKDLDINIPSLSVGIDLLGLLKGQLAISKAHSNDITFSSIMTSKESVKTANDKPIEAQISAIVKTITTRLDINDLRIINTQVSLTKPNTDTPAVDILVNQLSCSDIECNKLISADGSANNIDFSVHLSATNDDHQSDVSTHKIEAVLGQSSVIINTKLNNVKASSPIEAIINADIPLINEWLNLANIDMPNIGPLNIRGKLHGELNGQNASLNVNDINIDLNDSNIKVAVNGDITHLGEHSKTDLAIKSDINSIDALTTLLPSLNNAKGKLNLNMMVNGIGNKIDVNVQTFDATMDDANIRANGTINDVFHAFTIKKDDINQSEPKTPSSTTMPASPTQAFEIVLNGSSLNIVNYFLPESVRMPQWGPIKGKLSLAQEPEGIALNNIDITMQGASNASISGNLALYDLTQSKLALSATLNNLNEISSFTQGELPSFGPVSLNGEARFSSQKFQPSLNDITGGYSGEHGNLDITGNIGNLFQFKDANLAWNGNVKSIKIAEVFSTASLPDLGPIKTSGIFASKPRPNNPELLELDLRDIKATINDGGTNLSVAGSITNLISEKANLDIDSTIDAGDLSLINAFVKEGISDLGKIKGGATIKGSVINGFNIGLNDIQLDGENFQARANGEFLSSNEIRSEKGIEITANANSLQSVLKQFNIATDIDGKTDVSLIIKPIQDGIAISDARLSIDDNLISTDLNFTKPQDGTPFIGGIVNITNVNLIKLLNIKDKKDNTDEKDKVDKPKTPFFNETPLFTTYFKNINTDITFNIERLTTQFLDLSNTQTSLVAKNGILNIGPLDTTVAGGRVQFEIQSNLTIKPEITSIYFNADNIAAKQLDLARNADQVGEDSKLTALIDIQGEGATNKAFMSTLEGKALLDFRNLNVKSSALKLIGTDFLFNLIETINPFSESTNRIPFNCAIVNLDIKHGIASSKTGIAAESDSFVVIGDANITFETEKLDAHIETKTTKGIGLSLSQFVNIVKVGGHIYDPKIAISGEGLLKTGASIGAAVFTGGATLLAQGIWDRISASGDICGAALNAEKVQIDKPSTRQKPSDNEGEIDNQNDR